MLQMFSLNDFVIEINVFVKLTIVDALSVASASSCFWSNPPIGDNASNLPINDNRRTNFNEYNEEDVGTDANRFSVNLDNDWEKLLSGKGNISKDEVIISDTY